MADLCCGVGISTRALREAFPNADAVVGVDTSPQMVAMAEFLTEHTDHLAWAKPFFAKFGTINTSISTNVLKEQRSKVRRAIKFLLRNAEETSLPSASFDLVTVMYAFHEGKKKHCNVYPKAK